MADQDFGDFFSAGASIKTIPTLPSKISAIWVQPGSTKRMPFNLTSSEFFKPPNTITEKWDFFDATGNLAWDVEITEIDASAANWTGLIHLDDTADSGDGRLWIQTSRAGGTNLQLAYINVRGGSAGNINLIGGLVVPTNPLSTTTMRRNFTRRVDGGGAFSLNSGNFNLYVRNVKYVINEADGTLVSETANFGNDSNYFQGYVFEDEDYTVKISPAGIRGETTFSFRSRFMTVDSINGFVNADIEGVRTVISTSSLPRIWGSSGITHTTFFESGADISSRFISYSNYNAFVKSLVGQ